MDDASVVKRVGQHLMAAEQSYEEEVAELDGLERVLEVLRRILHMRDTIARGFEETGPIDSLLEECHYKLEQFMNVGIEQYPSSQLNLAEWANSIENDIRAQEPLALSFESAGYDSENEESKSVKFSSRRGGPLSSGSKWRRDTVSSRGATTLLRVLKSNGKFMDKSEVIQGQERDDGFFCMTTAAWTFAVIGMMITIGFLSGDFRAAQRNLAIEIDQTNPTSQRLPAVTICGNPKNIPAFRNYPSKKYPGLPLFGVSQLIRHNRSSGRSLQLASYFDKSIESLNETLVEDVVVTNIGTKFKSRPQGFNVKREIGSLYDVRAVSSFESLGNSNDGGFYCIRIGKKEEEILQPFENQNSTHVVTPSIEIRVFKSRLFSACRSRFLRRDRFVISVFISELILFADGLEQRGILDFSGFDHSVLEESLLGLRAPYHIDFYCNVYFFSGFFYPSVDNADISYKYDPVDPFRWKQTGKGPYYSAYSWEKDAPLIVGPDVQALSNETYTLLGLRLFAQNADDADDSGIVKPSTVISVLDAAQTSTIVFQRVQVEGKIEYHVREELGFSPKTVRKIIDVFHIKMDFSSFATERIRASPTMSWPEFLTDVFEFVGLFTGICIFTLIVAPAHSLV